MVSESGRVYSARERAQSKGVINPAEKRTEDDLRTALVKSHGCPCFYGAPPKKKGGAGVSDPDDQGMISMICAPFFAGLYAKKHDIFFEQEEMRFYSYHPKTGLWCHLDDAMLLKDVRSFLLAESRREFLAPGFPTVRMEPKLSFKLDNEIIARLKGECGIMGAFRRSKDFLKGDRVVHLANGVVLIRDGKVKGFEEGFDKRHFSRNQCSVAYDPKADCPRFVEEFLRPSLYEETVDADIRSLFQFLGLALFGFNVYQKILILSGAAESGKTTFAKLVAQLVGIENTNQLRTQFLGDRFELGACLGKTLLTGIEADAKFFLSPGAGVLTELSKKGLD